MPCGGCLTLITARRDSVEGGVLDILLGERYVRYVDTMIRYLDIGLIQV